MAKFFLKNSYPLKTNNTKGLSHCLTNGLWLY
jgi:hypothetical protein